MGKDIFTTIGEHLTVKAFAGGVGTGFNGPTPAISICTEHRTGAGDYVALSLDEAEQISKAILKHVRERRKRK